MHFKANKTKRAITQKLSLAVLIAIFSTFLFSDASAGWLEEFQTTISRALDKSYGDDYEKKLEKLAGMKTKVSQTNTVQSRLLLRKLQLIERRIILENLEDYTNKKYIESGAYQKEDFLRSYQAVKSADAKADIHPSYARSLGQSIKNSSVFIEDSKKYKAFVYVLFSLSEKMHENPEFENDTVKTWKQAWEFAESGTGIKINESELPSYKNIFETVSKKEKIQPFNSEDLARMRGVIWKEKVSPGSAYFKAYLYLLDLQNGFSGHISLSTKFDHNLQVRTLSCESNSATDLINYYRIRNGISSIAEDEFISVLPIRDDEILRVKENGKIKLVWWDPHRYFVGKLDGKQSSNPNILTGYGIYAEGIAPIINHFLSPQNLMSYKDDFDEKKILDSLSKGNPVLFWYLLPISEDENGNKKYSTKPIVWQSPEWKEIKGYVGQHTGIIVGAHFDKLGKIQTISFYQGRNKNLETVDFQEIKKTASLFNEALYVREVISL